jgi:hypothetical protein
MDHAKQQRALENEALFRTVNENVDAAAEKFEPQAEGSAFEYLCECSDPDCAARVDMTRAEYLAVRAHPRRFLVLPGHVQPAVERVVERHRAYLVVEKAA